MSFSLNNAQIISDIPVKLFKLFFFFDVSVIRSKVNKYHMTVWWVPTVSYILSLTSTNLHLSIPQRFFLHMKKRIFNCPNRLKLQSHCVINPMPQINIIGLFCSEIWWTTSGITPAKLPFEALFFWSISAEGQGSLDLKAAAQQEATLKWMRDWGYLEMLLC